MADRLGNLPKWLEPPARRGKPGRREWQATRQNGRNLPVQSGRFGRNLRSTRSFAQPSSAPAPARPLPSIPSHLTTLRQHATRPRPATRRSAAAPDTKGGSEVGGREVGQFARDGPPPPSRLVRGPSSGLGLGHATGREGRSPHSSRFAQFLVEPSTTGARSCSPPLHQGSRLLSHPSIHPQSGSGAFLIPRMSTARDSHT